MQATVGVSRLAKLPQFIAARRRNSARLKEGLLDLEDVLILPEAEPNSERSWFGSPMLVRQDVPFRRVDLVAQLEASRIGTRPVFAGNLIRQPAYADQHFRVVGDLANSDRVMNDAFRIGVFPGISDTMIDYMVDSIRRFCRA